MLFGIYHPFTDLRDIKAPGIARLDRPDWPNPIPGWDHLRGIGPIRLRPKDGFDGWVGENVLAIGGSAFALRLPRHAAPFPNVRFRLIRKAGYFDGLLNGRIEVLIGVEGLPPGRRAALRVVDYLLGIPVRVPTVGIETRLGGLTEAAARVWANATMMHLPGGDARADLVHGGRPLAVAESRGLPALPVSPSDPPDAAIEVVVPRGRAPVETVLIAPTAATQRARGFRRAGRYLRTYCQRLRQDIESLSLLLADETIDPGRDEVQHLLNEYTRRINRSRLHLENVQGRAAIEWSYAAFARIYPGKVDALRTRIVRRNLRPNVARKVLAMLDASETSKIIVYGDYREETIMGDKFENIQGSTIVNRSTLSNAMNEVRYRHDDEVAQALSEIAAYVETAENEGAAILMNSLAEEAAKEEPDKSKLRQLWDGIVAVLPGVTKLAGAVGAVAKLFA
ncbi:MAG: hypothetical protein AAGE03_15355 [Pseudomonadota bacterium]